MRSIAALASSAVCAPYASTNFPSRKTLSRTRFRIFSSQAISKVLFNGRSRSSAVLWIREGLTNCFSWPLPAGLFFFRGHKKIFFTICCAWCHCTFCASRVKVGMAPFNNLTGRRFGFHCSQCGRSKIVLAANLLDGRSKSCGCTAIHKARIRTRTFILLERSLALVAGGMTADQASEKLAEEFKELATMMPFPVTTAQP